VDGKPFPRLGVPAACAPLNVRLVSRLLYNRALTIMWQLFTRPARNVTTTLQFAIAVRTAWRAGVLLLKRVPPLSAFPS
jgi:hypothetical protein